MRQSGPASESTNQRPSHWSHLWPLLAVVLLSFAIRIWRIEKKSVWWDESLSLYRAQQSVPFILSGHIDFPGLSTRDQHPPLYFLLLHWFTRFLGERDLMLRFPSVAFATLTVPLLYTLGTRLWDRRVGLLAALLGAASPFYLWYAQEARMYMMVTCLGLGSVYAQWRGMTSRKRWWIAGAGILALSALFTHFLYVLVLCAQLVLALVLWYERHSLGKRSSPTASKGGWSKWRRVPVYLSIALCVFVVTALGYWILARLGPTRSGQREYVPVWVILQDIVNSYSIGLSMNLRQAWPWDALFVATYLLGLGTLFRRHPPTRARVSGAGHSHGAARVALVAGYLLIPVGVVWIASLYAPFYINSRYLIAASPAFYLGVALGLDRLTRRFPFAACAVGAALLAGTGISTYQFFFHERYSVQEDYRSVAVAIRNGERVGDVVVVNSPESMTAFEHYFRGRSPVIGMPFAGSDDARVAADMSQIAVSFDRIWLVRGRIAIIDPERRVTAWLDENTLLQARKMFPSWDRGIAVSTYLTQWPVRPGGGAAVEPIGSFGDLSLLEATIRYRDANGSVVLWPYTRNAAGERPVPSLPPIAAGSRASALLIWRPERVLDSLKTSLRLVRDDTIWSQQDEAPFMYLSTVDWPVGQAVRHEIDLRVPPGTPPGAYRLQLLIYEETGGQSIQFSSGADGLEPVAELCSIEVSEAVGSIPDSELVPAAATRVRPRTVFGGTMQLVGHHYYSDTVSPGDSIVIQLYWRALEEAYDEYDLVINWVDDDGDVWHVVTTTLTGTDPASHRWSAGQVVQGIIRLPVPDGAPHGSHRLHLLVRSREAGFAWVRRGIIPWAGHDVFVGRITIQ